MHQQTESNTEFGITQSTLGLRVGPLLDCMTRRGPRPPGQMRLVLAENLKRELRERFPHAPDLSTAFSQFSNVPRTTVWRVLTGHMAPTLDTLEQIADALDIQTYRLLMPSERMAKKFTPEDTTVIQKSPVFDNSEEQRVLHSKRPEDRAIGIRRARIAGRAGKRKPRAG